MNYKIEKMNEFTLIGFEKIISNRTGFEDCPAFWGEFTEGYMQPIMEKGKPEMELAMIANIEWYSQGDTNSDDYESGIFIPVKINN